jgi:hypothetical protein
MVFASAHCCRKILPFEMAARPKYSRGEQGRTKRDMRACYTAEPAGATSDACEHFAKSIFRVPYCTLCERHVGARARCGHKG